MAKKTKNPDRDIATIVYTEMKRQDQTAKDTAEGAGIHRLTLIRWLNGQRNMTAAQLAQVLDYLAIKLTPARR